MSVRTADVTPRAPASFPTCFERSARVKRRRGLAFLAMTLVLPGSAQLAGGSRSLGRIALRIWITLWLLVLLAGVLTLIQPKAAVAALTLAPTLKAIQIGIVVVGLGWVVLIVDAWRLANPGEQGGWGRLVFSILTVAVALTVFGGFIAVASMASAQHELTTTVFSGGGDQVAKQGRYNILLLGGDADRIASDSGRTA